MKRNNLWCASITFVMCCSLRVLGEGLEPLTVSPGATDRLTGVEVRCPTFSWQAVSGAVGYEVVVYELPPQVDLAAWSLDDAAEVLFVALPAGVTAWTPSLETGLVRGADHVWFVRGVLGDAGLDDVDATEWSAARFFRVAGGDVQAGERQVSREWGRFSDADADSDEGGAIPRGARAVSDRSAMAKRVGEANTKEVGTALAAIRGEMPGTSGETYGVVGTSNSAEGAGLGAVNAAGGPDLVLDGVADGESDLLLFQWGVDRASAAVETFEFINSIGGSVDVSVQGQVTAVNFAGDGALVTDVDAETLDGFDSAAFAPLAHLHDDRYFTEGELNTSGGGGAVHWGNLSALPAGFADGVDDVATYTVGDGIIMDGGQIRLDPLAFVPRVAIVDSASDVGQFSSIAVGSDGFALISYYDATNDNLKVAHCEDDGCTTTTVTVLDSIGSPGSATSIAIGGDGLGLISYVDQTTYELKIAHCSNAACTGATITTLDSAGLGVGFPSVATGVDGLGLISYSHGNDDLMVAHCTNAACTNSTLSTLDSTVRTGFSSLTIGGDGLGLISYCDKSNHNLKIAHCTSAACTNASTITLAPVGIFTCPTSVTTGADGFGLVSYPDDDFGDLRVAHCLDAACSAATINIVSGSASVGSDSTSIAVDSSGFGLIIYTYTDLANTDLMVGRCTNIACTSVVTRAVDRGGHGSIAVGADGRPWVSYSNNYLKVVHLPYGY